MRLLPSTFCPGRGAAHVILALALLAAGCGLGESGQAETEASGDEGGGGEADGGEADGGEGETGSDPCATDDEEDPPCLEGQSRCTESFLEECEIDEETGCGRYKATTDCLALNEVCALSGGGTAYCEPLEPGCGNGALDPGEECDDANDRDDDACRTDCMFNVCGDGFRGPTEACDDGNDIDDDACRSDCALPTCGDAKYAEGEGCDDGNDVNGDGCSTRCLPEVVRLATGSDHNCVIFSDGRVRCWGENTYGQLGLGDVDHRGDDELPRELPYANLPAQAEDLALGANNVCALLVTGELWCWGRGDRGEHGHPTAENLGDDESGWSLGPVQVGGKVLQIAAESSRACALREDGALFCWGKNDQGELGYGHKEGVGMDYPPEEAGPYPLDFVPEWVRVTSKSTCVGEGLGGVRCWGFNKDGWVGLGFVSQSPSSTTPEVGGPIFIGEPVLWVESGTRHYCAALEGGRLRCWGAGNGQLGYGNMEVIGDDELPAHAGDVPLDGPVAHLSAGGYHNCYLDDEGDARCWGAFNGYGKLGTLELDAIGDDEPATEVPVIDVGLPIRALSGGLSHTCALTELGTVRCWGKNDLGQLGHGSTRHLSSVPLVTGGDVALR